MKTIPQSSTNHEQRHSTLLRVFHRQGVMTRTTDRYMLRLELIVATDWILQDTRRVSSSR